MLATLMNALRSELGQLVLLVGPTIGIRVWGYRFLSKAARNAGARPRTV
jgi:hypothetical protein